MLALSQIGAENLTVSTAAVTFASAEGARALIYVADAPIRWRADGTAPTATTGMFVPAGEHIDWTEADGDYTSMINHVQFIRDTTAAGDATLAVAYFS